MNTVEFDHNILDRVRIKTIETIGNVDAISQDIQGKQYRVVYWSDGQRNSVWMYTWEIEATKRES